MGKVNYRFEDFLAEVRPGYRDFAAGIHGDLLRDGYKGNL